MAESESGQDKTEEPTEKRRREAREKGQLPRSRELNTLAILMAGAGGLLIYGADLAGALLRLMRSNFELSRETAMNTESMLQLLGASAYLAAQGLWPILLMLLVAAIVGPIALGGWLFSMDALQPKFSRLNPLSGLKRMFSAKSLLELSKALIKFLVVLAVA
ncbi:EscU/YscU/HrcU family type III secretion system export apparatus switch protein, partial [Pseudomonas aeruginosa]|nr:EscU/YscU/HrcU family type III secretion system export apparatus switch protein [Pseudomonas aeruginosa]